jgi:flagellar biogenesis protein FliO
MTHYLVNFSIYTLAMVGVIFGALFVFKTFSNKCFSKKSSMLKIEDSMSLSPRKTLYVINAKNESFLIASDIDRTSLIAKLDTKCEAEILSPASARSDKSSNLASFDGIESIGEFTSLIDFQKERSNKRPMMKELARKLNGER